MKKTRFLTAVILIGVFSCTRKENSSDAYGSFDATDITLSSEVTGKIVTLPVETGSRLEKGELIAVIDTTILSMQKAELDLQIESIRTKLAGITSQMSVIDQQITNVEVDFRRIKNLLSANAATRKQYDDLDGNLKILTKQREIQITQKLSVTSEINILKQKIEFIDEQLRRCYVYAPIACTILENYVELYELTAIGKPLVKIADLSRMTLTVYVSAQQMKQIKISDTCTVLLDNDDNSSLEFPGTISWISDQAEFTPKIIQTKEVRVNLVYAVKIRVANDGNIKIGMPGEVLFGHGAS